MLLPVMMKGKRGTQRGRQINKVILPHPPPTWSWGLDLSNVTQSKDERSPDGQPGNSALDAPAHPAHSYIAMVTTLPESSLE